MCHRDRANDKVTVAPRRRGARPAGGYPKSATDDQARRRAERPVPVVILLDEVIVAGRLDKRLVHRALHRVRARLDYCYEKAMWADPDLPSTSVTVRFSIGDDGRVSAASATGLERGDVDRCVVSMVEDMTLPTGSGTSQVEATLRYRNRCPFALPEVRKVRDHSYRHGSGGSAALHSPASCLASSVEATHRRDIHSSAALHDVPSGFSARHISLSSQ